MNPSDSESDMRKQQFFEQSAVSVGVSLIIEKCACRRKQTSDSAPGGCINASCMTCRKRCCSRQPCRYFLVLLKKNTVRWHFRLWGLVRSRSMHQSTHANDPAMALLCCRGTACSRTHRSEPAQHLAALDCAHRSCSLCSGQGLAPGLALLRRRRA